MWNVLTLGDKLHFNHKSFSFLTYFVFCYILQMLFLKPALANTFISFSLIVFFYIELSKLW